MSLNDLKEEFGPEISDIANDVSNSLPMSKPQLRSAFNDDELKELHSMIKDVNSATDENQKVVKVANHAKSALNLLKKLGVGL